MAWGLSTDGRLPTQLLFGGIIPCSWSSTSSSCSLQSFQPPFRPPHPTPVQAKGNTSLLRPQALSINALLCSGILHSSIQILQYPNMLPTSYLPSSTPVILSAGSSLTSPMSPPSPLFPLSLFLAPLAPISSPWASHSN